MTNDKNINEAIKYYNLALKNSSEREEAAWKLLRAYYFLGCFAKPNAEERFKVFEKAQKEGRLLYNEFPNNPQVAYWYSVDMALWAKEVNPFRALNAGCVKETREIAGMLITTEKKGDSISAARGYQIMAVAHQKIPRIAFVLNWVRKDSAEFYFKKSLSLNPRDLATSLFLAEYYKESGKVQDAENLLLPIIKNKPRTDEYLEDERNLRKMKKLLATS